MLLREMLKTPAARRRIQSEACGLSMIQELPIREQASLEGGDGRILRVFIECPSGNFLKHVTIDRLFVEISTSICDSRSLRVHSTKRSSMA
jgi:hypothetical protein